MQSLNQYFIISNPSILLSVDPKTRYFPFPTATYPSLTRFFQSIYCNMSSKSGDQPLSLLLQTVVATQIRVKSEFYNFSFSHNVPLSGQRFLWLPPKPLLTQTTPLSGRYGHRIPIHSSLPKKTRSSSLLSLKFSTSAPKL